MLSLLLLLLFVLLFFFVLVLVLFLILFFFSCAFLLFRQRCTANDVSVSSVGGVSRPLAPKVLIAQNKTKPFLRININCNQCRRPRTAISHPAVLPCNRYWMRLQQVASNWDSK